MTHSSKKYISILLALLYLMVSMPALASSAEECTHINFENGLCADCGTPCSHPENHYIDASENLSNYTSVDNSQHLVTYSNYTFIKCGLCEQEVPGTRSEPATQSLPMCHTYNDAGVCDSCGHTNTCTHSDTRAVPAQSNMHDYVSVSSTQHSYKCDWYESLYCYDCDTYRREAELVEANATRTENHDWEIDGATGVCSQCQYACAHDEIVANSFLDGEAAYAPVDNATHTVTGSYYEKTWCANCGAVLSTGDPETKTLSEDHDYENGVCTDCQYACPHSETEAGSFLDGEAVYAPADDESHTMTYSYFEKSWCNDCGLTLATDGPKTETNTEDHSFANGVCIDCGHTCAHPENAHETYELNQGDFQYTILNDKQHMYTVTEYLETRCDICYTTLSQSDSWQATDRNSHFYDASNVCAECGYVNTCTHPENQIFSSSWVEGDAYEPVNSQMHRCTGDLMIQKYCNNCDMTLSESIAEENHSTLYYHSFDEDLRCMDCGYTITCEHPEDKIVVSTYYGNRSDFVSVDADSHEFAANYCEEKYCSLCRTQLSFTVLQTGCKAIEQHNISGNTCKLCGYETTCTHPKNMRSTTFSNRGNSFVPKNAIYHTGTGIRIKSTICNACHSTLSATVTDSNCTFKEKHTFVDGICKQCGYANACEHPAKRRKVVQAVYSGEIISSTSREHTWSGIIQNNTICSACGECLDYELIVNSTLTEKHTFKNGFCIVCAEKKPATSNKDTSSEPVVTYTEIAATEVTHGISAASPLRMAETLLTAAEQLTLENEGKTLSIALMHADELLTDGEMITFGELSVSEQALVLLSVIGYQEEVAHYLTENELTLSGEAQALTASVNNRVAAMTDDERAAHTALIEEFFPVETITANDADCELIMIELQITIDGATHYERYGFCPDELNDWYFHNLSVSNEITA